MAKRTREKGSGDFFDISPHHRHLRPGLMVPALWPPKALEVLQVFRVSEKNDAQEFSNARSYIEGSSTKFRYPCVGEASMRLKPFASPCPTSGRRCALLNTQHTDRAMSLAIRKPYSTRGSVRLPRTGGGRTGWISPLGANSRTAHHEVTGHCTIETPSLLRQQGSLGKSRQLCDFVTRTVQTRGTHKSSL